MRPREANSPRRDGVMPSLTNSRRFRGSHGMRVAVISAIFAATLLSVSNEAEVPRRFVRSSSRAIPVCARVDLVVVGGSEGGIAAAWAAAKAGSSVLIVNSHYFFSDDVAAKARYWLEPDEVPQEEFSKKLFDGMIHAGSHSEIVPGFYKKRIEQLLLDAGVQFHFNSWPAGVLVDDAGQVAGVVTANKAGLQAVVAKVVIDTASTRYSVVPPRPRTVRAETISTTSGRLRPHWDALAARTRRRPWPLSSVARGFAGTLTW